MASPAAIGAIAGGVLVASVIVVVIRDRVREARRTSSSAAPRPSALDQPPTRVDRHDIAMGVFAGLWYFYLSLIALALVLAAIGVVVFLLAGHDVAGRHLR